MVLVMRLLFKLATIGCLAALHPAYGADEPLFKGKRVAAIIVSSPGGGTDLSTRLVGRFLQKHLPGQPDITFRNIPADKASQA